MPETATKTLTKTDIKALKQCDSICFGHAPEGGDHHFQSGIRAIKRGKAPFYEDFTHHIACHSHVSLHGTDKPSHEAGKGATCFAMIMSAKYTEEWATIVSLLKEGDEIHLDWVGCDNNGYLNRAQVTDRDESCHDAGLGMKLCHDRLYLRVRRGGNSKYRFYVLDSVCPNNSARMCRPR